MEIIELSSTEKDQYNRFVAGQTSGSFLQSWEWGEWQAGLGRQVKRLKFKVESGDTAATIQLIKTPLPFGKYYLYAPYGPVMSEKYKGESIKLLQELRKNFSDAIFVRIEPKIQSSIFNLQSSIFKSSNIQPGKTLLVDLSKTEDRLLAEMHPKTRYNIKVAQKHGVEIKDEFDISVGHGLFAKEAVQLIAQTAQRQGFKGYSVGYYNKLIDFLAVKNRGDLQLHIYKAIYQNKILAAAIMLDFGRTRTFLFGGSSERDKNVMAPYLLHWQAMRDAAALGMQAYDFWGTETSSGDMPGFVRFKLGFGGREVEYSGAYDIIINRLWYWAYNLLRAANKTVKKVL